VKAQRIRVQPRGSTESGRTAIVSGWLGTNGPSTYLWLGYKDSSGREMLTGILDGPQLYRLAKAIVRRFEGQREGDDK
jgi:hypothetical protein